MRSANKIGREAAAAIEKTVADIKTPLPDMKDDGAELKAAVAPKKAETFAEAFRRNRAEKGAGQTFTWNGKSFTTNMAGEGAKRAAPSRSSTAPTRRPMGTQAKPAADVSAKTKQFISNLPLKPKAEAPAAPKAEPRTSKDRSAEARARMGAALDTVNPIKAIARGVDYVLSPPSSKSAPERPAPNKAQRLEKMRRDAEAPGASGFAKSRYRDALASGMYKKGGKVRSIDGAAIRGKTRAMRKK